MIAQLDLFTPTATTWRERLPDWFGNFVLGKSEDDDSRFPVEELPEVGTRLRRYTIALRNIEDGVWLWGVDVHWATGGVGFAPFRKWGPLFAAMSRAEAVQSATLYALAKLEAAR